MISVLTDGFSPEAEKAIPAISETWACPLGKLVDVPGDDRIQRNTWIVSTIFSSALQLAYRR
ncbi:hypothetical protein J25TS5_19200 [Paenibacillus faecis]|nr:hypothetical protein J25TS5_19200 [Paenibacillus faecis]